MIEIGNRGENSIMGHVIKRKHLTSSQIIMSGFLGVILIGMVLLMLPISSKNGQWTGILEAMFTATSSVCVTGLVIYDTATYWSWFGQGVILLLIQIGGMGVVTLAVSIAIISGKKIGLMQRSTMQEAISAPRIGGIVKLTGFILRTTLVIEILGAILLSFVFCKDFGLGRGFWYALFHSISAFCNAGFDLMGETTPFSSLTRYQDNPFVNIVIMGLIVIGGIGFLTWDDIKTNYKNKKKCRMQTKVILLMTTILIIVPTILFLVFEFSGSEWCDMTFGEKVLGAMFQAVTPRTAGFNTVDLTQFSEAGIMIMIFLMLTGGAPGSTAGGMKITTVAVLFLNMFAVFHKKESTECFGRRIEEQTVKNAASLLVLYLILPLTGAIAISGVEQLPMLTCFFETASAIGTVGLTLGITSTLSAVSKIILVLLMFFGRVGGLTLAFATISEKQAHGSSLPKEKITVG